MAMAAVGRAAGDMITEVGRQFREIPGLREGTAKADYARCVDISTKAAIREMVLPGLLAVTVPVVIGFISKDMLGGLLVGVTVSGVLMAIFQSNAGGAWDNAKKQIEAGYEHNGVIYKKGTEAHKAAVVGDTVGDPLKDTVRSEPQHPRQAHRGGGAGYRPAHRVTWRKTCRRAPHCRRCARRCLMVASGAVV
jgi:K(+)-stimulated pyrophosphate-energized sodium pump